MITMALARFGKDAMLNYLTEVVGPYTEALG